MRSITLTSKFVQIECLYLLTRNCTEQKAKDNNINNNNKYIFFNWSVENMMPFLFIPFVVD